MGRTIETYFGCPQDIEWCLRNKYKGTAVIPVSAKSVRSIGSIVPLLVGGTAPRKSVLDIDYKTCGIAEEELGWLNTGMVIKSDTKKKYNNF